MPHPLLRPRALWLALLAPTLAACGVTSPKATRPLSLSITSRSASNASLPAPSAIQADIRIGSGANSITISKVQVVLARIELSPSGTCATTTGENDCDELQAGPVLLDLPVDGTTKVVLDGTVPAGTYSALQAKLDAVTADDDESGVDAFLKAHPEFKGISVQVTGVFTDANSQTHNFTFTSGAEAELEASFQPPVTVGASTSNLTINIDVASWFTDAAGKAIDPTNAANAEAIERNIRQSFKGFEDDNHDGVDDNKEAGPGTTHT
jgi:hypothetical protein